MTWREVLRRMLFSLWLAGMVVFFVWYGIKLGHMQKEREESIRKFEQKLDDMAKRAGEVCKAAVDLCNSVGAKGCGSCPP